MEVMGGEGAEEVELEDAFLTLCSLPDIAKPDGFTYSAPHQYWFEHTYFVYVSGYHKTAVSFVAQRVSLDDENTRDQKILFTTKWDSCADVHVPSGFHTCSRKEWIQLARLLVGLYELGDQYLIEHDRE